jgi:probable DNA metabolism protein
MNVFLYDKTFDGLLTAIFDAYSLKCFPDVLLGEGEPLPLFAQHSFTVVTSSKKADRVWKALEKKWSDPGCRMVRAVWLSGIENADMLLFRYMCKTLDRQESIETDFADPLVTDLIKLAGSVSREAEYVRQFVRFRKTRDGYYYAPVAPKYNVLPLTVAYFRSRFSDQLWVVFDTLRRYGYHYDLKEVAMFTFEEEIPGVFSGILQPEQMDNEEEMYQDFWRSYLQSLTIKARLNPKLQRQHMPVRFWKHLTEKQG